MTTFMSRPNKYDNFRLALNTFLKHNKAAIDESKFDVDFLIINEFPASGDEDKANRYMAKAEEKFPNVTFVQKDSDQKGQVASLNMILNKLETGEYKYWLRWEESWWNQKSVFAHALQVLEENLVDDVAFFGRDLKEYTKENFEFKKTKSGEGFWEQVGVRKEFWPGFSLRPGMTRSQIVLKAGKFKEWNDTWNAKFEYEWAKNFLTCGGRFAKLVGNFDDYVDRAKTHESTYNKTLKAKPYYELCEQFCVNTGCKEDETCPWENGENLIQNDESEKFMCCCLSKQNAAEPCGGERMINR